MTQPPAAMNPNPWDEAPAVEETPWENAPEVSLMDESLASPNQPVPGHPAERLASGMVRGGIAAINPINMAKAAYALGKMGVKTALAPSSVFQTGADIAHGIKETGAAALGQRGPEAAGEVYGGLLAAPVPVGRIAGGAARTLGATEASRAYNVKRALRVPPRTLAGGESAIAARVEAMAPEIDMPVVASPRKLARAMTAEREAAGAAVAEAAESLPQLEMRAAIRRAAGRIERPKGQRVVTSELQTPGRFEMNLDRGQYEWIPDEYRQVEKFVPDDPAKDVAYRASLRRLEEVAKSEAPVVTEDLLRMKRSAQGAADRGRAYTSERAGLAGEAAAERGAALRAELEAIPGPESRALTRANRRFEVAATAEEPIVAEAGRLSDLPIAGRGVEMLLGRAIPGSGFARQALGGLIGGQLLDSTLFHTASAAVKRRVIDALQSGQPQLATQILYEFGVAQSINRRSAEAALRAQGEGVTAP